MIVDPDTMQMFCTERLEVIKNLELFAQEIPASKLHLAFRDRPHFVTVSAVKSSGAMAMQLFHVRIV